MLMSLLVSILLKERPLETLCISFFTFVFRVDTPSFLIKNATPVSLEYESVRWPILTQTWFHST